MNQRVFPFVVLWRLAILLNIVILAVLPSAQALLTVRGRPIAPPFRSSSLLLAGRPPAPGSELFPGKGPYIPSGLSEDEYKTIKQKEEETRRKMNFGAWGPRFKQTEVPDGDWMVMPRLWTNGFDTRPTGASGGVEGAGLPLGGFLRDRGPGLVLAFWASSWLWTVAALVKATFQGRPPTTVPAVLQLVGRGLLLGLPQPLAWKPLAITALYRLVCLVGLQAPANQFVVAVNRQKLWAPRRILLVSTILSLLGLGGLSAVLALMSSTIMATAV